MITTATGLPFVPLRESDELGAAARSVKGAKWWTQVGSRVYHSPEAPSRLSTNINDYYYAMGSEGALTDELMRQRVGGEGRVHIFHLPKSRGGPSMLQTSLRGRTRRSSLSDFKRLPMGVDIKTQFPEYTGESNYSNPLSSAGQHVEVAAVAEVTKESFSEYLTKLVALTTRSYNSKKGTSEAVSLLKSEFEAMGMTVCTQGSGIMNVVGFVPGTSTGNVVVGAHYDSRPFSGAAPGAEDNGSGTAALLAMARAFMKTKVKPEKNVYFVAFGGEEPGLLGSTEFAGSISENNGQEIPAECRQAHSLEPDSTTAIIMDEIGWVSPSMKDRTVNLEAYDWTKDLMEHLVHSCHDHNGDSLKVVHNNAPFGSDHMCFLDRNMAAVLTINGDDEAYPNYHQSSDTIENVDMQYASEIAKMNMGALIRVAGVHSHSTGSSLSGHHHHDHTHSLMDTGP